VRVACDAAAGAAYLNYVGLLNQAVMMSTQLYNDATNPAHHKYAAHQVALLYVSTTHRACCAGKGPQHHLQGQHSAQSACHATAAVCQLE
jgi:hypothetical protein